MAGRACARHKAREAQMAWTAEMASIDHEAHGEQEAWMVGQASTVAKHGAS